MLLINEMVDMLDFPQATFQIRKWSEEDELWLLELIAQWLGGWHQIDKGKGPTKKAEFFVRVLFRRNASWQGEVQWLEGEKTKSFRSVLELISLMQEAMEASGSPEADYTLRTWESPE
jgi:hypothetical protein